MITIQSAPSNPIPGHNNINYVVSSDKTAQDNFRFVCDIYISGVTSPTYERRKADTDPTTGYGYFDVHRTIGKYLSTDVHVGTTGGWMLCDNNRINFTCKFGEEYGLNSSGTTVYPDLATSSKYAYNASFSYLDKIRQGGSEYTLASVLRSPLTDAPTTQYIYNASNRWLYYMATGDTALSPAKTMHIDIDDLSTLSPFEVLNPAFSIPAGQYNIFSFPTGINNIQEIDNVHYTTGSASTLATALSAAIAAGGTISFYTKNASGTQTSKTMTYSFANYGCSRFDIYTLHFVNRAGGVDTFDFSMNSKRMLKKETKEYKKRNGLYGSSVSYAESDQSRVSYHTKYNQTVRVNSDWVDEDTAEWLEQLMTSNQVWVEDITWNTIIPIKIVETDYETKRRQGGKLINISLTFEYMHDNYAQRL